MVPLKVPRGPSANRLAIVFDAGSMAFDTDVSRLFVGDGTTPGGILADGALTLAISAATYAILAGDVGRLIVFTHAGTVAVSMDEAASSSNTYFPAGNKVTLLNLAGGNVTVTPTTSLINGAATLVLEVGQSAAIYSYGAGYFATVDGSAGLGFEVPARVLSGSAVALTSGAPVTVATISLTPGVWEVSGAVGFAEAAGTIATEQIAAINTTLATLPTFPSAGTATAKQSGTSTTADGSILPLAPCRITVASGTQAVYLIAQATFTVSTNGAYGEIRAVKVG